MARFIFVLVLVVVLVLENAVSSTVRSVRLPQSSALVSLRGYSAQNLEDEDDDEYEND